MSTRHTLATLKSIAFAKWGVTTTRQLKKKYFPGYDFRTRAAWLEAAGLAPRQDMLCEGANNIVPFHTRYTAAAMLNDARIRSALMDYSDLFAEADRIMDDDLYRD